MATPGASTSTRWIMPQCSALVTDIMTDAQRKHFEEFLEIDFAFEIENLGRFRVNAFNQHRGAGAVLRTIPSKILTLKELNAPMIFADLALKNNGLVLVTGPTGSGKSTTLAAMVDHLNDKSSRPHSDSGRSRSNSSIESKNCLVNQREVGAHTR
jgi:twitching motility protein PilT